MKYKEIFKWCLISILMLLGIAQMNYLHAYAAETLSDISIQLLDKQNINESYIEASVEVCFYNMDYYNDQVYLSYHIFDELGKNYIYENERIKINLDENGKAKIDLNINLTEANNNSRNKNKIIEFDVVDEENIYWFSTNNEIKFQTDNLNTKISMAEKLIKEIQSGTLIFVINVIVFILCFITWGIISRKAKVK